ncbi:ATP-dependent DNA helicase RecG [Arenimonas sp.]|nr:ATP-dependent DNA helicase RecG [Candidatus Parcubacteria bacterium]
MNSNFLKKPISDIVTLSKPHQLAFEKLRIKTVFDVLYHFPVRYGDAFKATYIRDVEVDQTVVLYGEIQSVEANQSFRTKMMVVDATLKDDTGQIKLSWYNQIYISKMFREGDIVKVSGTIKETKGKFLILNPTIEKTKADPLNQGINLFVQKEEVLFLPIYRETRNLSSKYFHTVIEKIFKHTEFKSIIDTIPEDVRKKYSLPNLHDALIYIHSPRIEKDTEVAKKRFAFEEVFNIQLKNAKNRKDAESSTSYSFVGLDEALDNFRKHLSFDLTEAQEKSIKAIINDFKKTHPMSRLLEGDVGSGKTAVAAAASYAIVASRVKSMRDQDQKNARLQVAYMAPTEILAKQHYESFTQLFAKLPINIGLLTGSGCKKFPSKSSLLTNKIGTDISKNQMLKWIASGDISIVIGTHALIQKSVVFRDLAFVIIDEQHRFGTKQRQKLANKHLVDEETKNKLKKKDSLRVNKKSYIDNKNNYEGVQIIQTPHLLSMTATPIPRTLALTVYGDLDLSIVDQMPSGRKPIITEIISDEKREVMYKHVHTQLEQGRQVYVVCARIQDPDPDLMSRLNVKSVQEEAERLKKNNFKEYTIGILHGKMKTIEKDKTMKDFLDGKINILVATSVIEVGVNVPNATVIMIEGSDRFGLSQIHQLRGRVIRGTYQAYCYLCTSTTNAKTVERLNALKKAKNGFELAELDLKMRGAGELYGDKQWGLSDIGMEAIKNLKMVEAAREAAQELVEQGLSPELLKLVEENASLHME